MGPKQWLPKTIVMTEMTKSPLSGVWSLDSLSAYWNYPTKKPQQDALAWYCVTDAGLVQYQCRQCRHFGKLSTEFSLGTFRICEYCLERLKKKTRIDFEFTPQLRKTR